MKQSHQYLATVNVCSVEWIHQIILDAAELAATMDPDAEAEIAYVASRLGLTPLTDSGGKLESFIRRNCPTHLRVLVEAGYLKPTPAR